MHQTVTAPPNRRSIDSDDDSVRHGYGSSHRCTSGSVLPLRAVGSVLRLVTGRDWSTEWLTYITLSTMITSTNLEPRHRTPNTEHRTPNTEHESTMDSSFQDDRTAPHRALTRDCMCTAARRSIGWVSQVPQKRVIRLNVVTCRYGGRRTCR